MVKDFPSLPLEKLAKEAGKSVGADRISLSATKELKIVLLEIADKIAKDAVGLAYHAGRVTVKAEDVRLARRK